MEVDIKRIEFILEFAKKTGINYALETDDLKAIENLLKAYKEEEAIIEEMAKQLAGLAIFDDNIENALILIDKEEVIEYFRNKAKGEKE